MTEDLIMVSIIGACMLYVSWGGYKAIKQAYYQENLDNNKEER